ncbi:hypothetical protein [Vogesella mureinivorans]|uniref:hypothetical protein n=1 Tax=Vogesella mureinivorans TaxID=657276 RepID=UPI0011C71236|nr:hypothetical protein [Vogesella mureinivorans]
MSAPLLLPLDTVSFDAELPLAYQPQADAHAIAQALLTTRLALTVLASPADSTEQASTLQRLEAKLDLALELALQQRYPQAGALTPCRIGLESLCWLHPAPLDVGSSGMVLLQPSTPSALTLQLPLTIRQCQAAGHGYAIQASWAGSLGDAQADWERWVFRRHRQAIGRRA